MRFYTAAGSVNDLLEAQQNRTLSKLKQQINKLNLLILDELSYLTFARPSAELLFQILSSRNERDSLIITTNLDFSRWTEIFGDPMLTAAIVDRMTHRSHIVDTNGHRIGSAKGLRQMTNLEVLIQKTAKRIK